MTGHRRANRASTKSNVSIDVRTSVVTVDVDVRTSYGRSRNLQTLF